MTDQMESAKSSLSPRPARWIYDQSLDGMVADLPELMTVGSDKIRSALPLDEHAHPGCYEFVYIERGKAGWELDGAVYETLAGDLFHTRPGERHRGSFNVIEPSKFWWLLVQAPHRDGWLRLAPSEADAVTEGLRHLPRLSHTGEWPAEPFVRLKRALQSPDSPLRGVAIRQAVMELLLRLLDPQTTPGASVAPDLQKRIAELVARMHTDLVWRPTIDELAAEAAVSVSHFHRVFQALTGLSPISYIERMRMKEACRLLRETDTAITKIAHELGYSSSQHFATVFKRYTRTTPSAWRSKD